jgi:hypothetical protein
LKIHQIVHDVASRIVMHINYVALMSRKLRYLTTLLSCRCCISQVLLHSCHQNILILWCGTQLLRNSAQCTKCTERNEQANFQLVPCANNTFPFWPCPFLCGWKFCNEMSLAQPLWCRTAGPSNRTCWVRQLLSVSSPSLRIRCNIRICTLPNATFKILLNSLTFHFSPLHLLIQCGANY